MMYSFTAPSGLTYQHNGDFSGYITLPEVPGWIEEGATIPFTDIQALYLEYRRNRKIAELEAASSNDLEKLI